VPHMRSGLELDRKANVQGLSHDRVIDLLPPATRRQLRNDGLLVWHEQLGCRTTRRPEFSNDLVGVTVSDPGRDPVVDLVGARSTLL